MVARSRQADVEKHHIRPEDRCQIKRVTAAVSRAHRVPRRHQQQQHGLRSIDVVVDHQNPLTNDRGIVCIGARRQELLRVSHTRRCQRLRDRERASLVGTGTGDLDHAPV